MNNTIHTIGYLILLIIASGCNDFLDQVPDNRTELKRVEAISELLVSAYPMASYSGFCEAMSDNVNDKGIDGKFVIENEEAYFWSEKYSDYEQDTPEYYWNMSYEAIAASNQAIDAIAELGNPKEALPYKGEALLARAYSHFMLVNLFSKPYNIQTANNDLGIPYVTEPEEVVMKNYQRGTVANVYQLIKMDIEEGIPLIQDQAYESAPKYHFNRAAAHGFASRFYLYKGDWEQAILHANKVISSTPQSQMRNWEGEYRTYTYAELEAQYTHYEESANLLLAGQQTWWGRNFIRARYSLTADKRAEILDSAIISGGSWSYSVYGSELYLNIPKLKEHFKYSSINATTGVGYVMSPLITFEEVLLNRAEAYIMNNQFEQAIEDLNTFLSMRISAFDANNIIDMATIKAFYKLRGDNLNPYYELSENQLAAVKCVTMFRRVEYIHEGMRWFDIRRFRLPVVHKTDPPSEEQFILAEEDLRKQLQIPEVAIEFGLTANPR